MNCDKFRENENCECSRKKTMSVFDRGHPKIKYILKNPKTKELCRIKIDDGYLQSDNQKKCDFLVLNCESNAAYFVELKGSNLIQAVKQIKRTIDILISNSPAKSINARIILSKVSVPRFENNPDYLKLKKLLKKYNGTLVQRTRFYEEMID